MADVFSAEKRREIMASISAKDTKPELMLRKSLHRQGYRYRLHSKHLPGKPDLVFAKFNAAVFVNGCFWHGHGCHLFRLPSSNREYWKNKIDTNRSRDEKVRSLLLSDKWRVLTVWECSMKGKGRLEIELLISKVEEWLKSDIECLEIQGNLTEK